MEHQSNKSIAEYRNITEFNKGQSSRVIKEAAESPVPFIIMKNGKPLAVMISYRKYSDLVGQGVNFADDDA